MQIKKIMVWLLSYVSRWLWRLIVFAAIFLALVISAGREMAPLLREHKAWLEANLTASTGEIITVHEVNAYWEGLVPELAVKQLTISNSVQVDSALMRVDLLGSIRARTLVFDTLDINQAVVKISLASPDTQEAFDFRAGREFLFGSADIRIRNLDMTLIQGADNQLTLHVDELTVQNDKNNHRLNAAISVDQNNNLDPKAPVQLLMSFDGDAGDIFSGVGRAYIELGDKKNLQWCQQFLAHAPSEQSFFNLIRMENTTGNIWALWKDQRIEWVSELSIANMEIMDQGMDSLGMKKKSPNKHTHTIDFSGQLAGYVLMEDMSGKEYFVHSLPGQTLSINQHTYPLPVTGLRYFYAVPQTENHFFLYFPDLNLAEMMRYIDLFPSKTLQGAVKTLNPSGHLKDVLIDFPLGGSLSESVDAAGKTQSGVVVRANLNQVSVSAWHDAPSLSLVDGYLEASANSGFVEVASQQGFNMHFPHLYRKPMKYDRAYGRINWDYEPRSEQIYVGSSDLDLHGDDGELRGAFWLSAPPAHSPQAAELYLAASLIDTPVKFRDKYLPYTLNPSLKNWLSSSIKDGVMSESSFIYRGSLRKHEPQERRVILFSKVKDASLKFDPEWPALTNVDGFLSVNDEAVYARIAKARFMEFKINHAEVNFKSSANKDAHFLTWQSDMSGPGNDIFRVTQETPLSKTFENVFDDWKLAGEIEGHVSLGIQIGSAAEPNFQELDLHLSGNDLMVGGVNLPLEQLKGDFHYSSTGGLTASHLDARLWNKDQIITITPEVDSDALPDILVNVKGAIDPQAVATWAHLPFVHFLQGDIPAETSLNIPIDAKVESMPVATLHMVSDMKGIAIDLPAPFAKLADKALSTTMAVDLWKTKQKYKIEYGSFISALIEKNNNGGLKGDIAINQQDDLPAVLPDYLRVRATLDQASLSNWLPVMERHNSFAKADAEKEKQTNKGLSENSNLSTSPVFDLMIKNLKIGSMKLDDIKLLLNYQSESNGNYWNIDFKNLIMAGHYQYFDDAKRLPQVDFDTVKLGDADEKLKEAASVEDDSKRVDPLADVIPQDLPAIQVHAKQVFLKGDDVGDWRFVLMPNKEGVDLNNLVVVMSGLTIDGLDKNQGAKIRWLRDGNHIETEATTHVSLSNQDGVKNLFGIERIVEADKTDIQGTVTWKGSPAMISFRRLQGDLSIFSEKGRFLNSTSSTDLMRVINVFNFSTWARRLKLDFTDLYKKGVSYDKVEGHIILDQGKVFFDKPMKMKGPSGRFELQGNIDSVQNTIDASLIVTIPVNQNATWIAALAAGLPVAAGVWAVSKIFGDQIDKLSSVNYSVSGSLDEPKVKFVGLLPELSKDNSSKDAPTKDGVLKERDNKNTEPNK